MKYTELRSGDLFKVVGIEATYRFVKIRPYRGAYRHYDEVECQLMVGGVAQPFSTTFIVEIGEGKKLEVELCGIDAKLYNALCSCYDYLIAVIPASFKGDSGMMKIFKTVEDAQNEFKKQYPSYELK
jgi:hypothetical protein